MSGCQKVVFCRTLKTGLLTPWVDFINICAHLFCANEMRSIDRFVNQCTGLAKDFSFLIQHNGLANFVKNLVKLNGDFFCRTLCAGNFSIGAMVKWWKWWNRPLVNSWLSYQIVQKLVVNQESILTNFFLRYWRISPFFAGKLVFLLHIEKKLFIAKWPSLTPKKKKRRKKSFVGSTPVANFLHILFYEQQLFLKYSLAEKNSNKNGISIL
jgi:hypothetical protein